MDFIEFKNQKILNLSYSKKQHGLENLNIKNYKYNPILFFMHEMDSPIGTVRNLYIKDNYLFGDIKIVENNRIDIKILQAYLDSELKFELIYNCGYRTSISDSVETEFKDIRIYKNAELLEISLMGLK
jgi:hypothetical protein